MSQLARRQEARLRTVSPDPGFRRHFKGEQLRLHKALLLSGVSHVAHKWCIQGLKPGSGSC